MRNKIQPFNLLSSYIQFFTNTMYIILTLVGFKTGFIEQERYNKKIIALITHGGPIYVKYSQMSSRNSNNNSNLLKGIQMLEDNVHVLEHERDVELNYLRTLELQILNSDYLGSGSIASVYDVKYKNRNAVAK